MDRMKGKRAFLTAAGAGIGRATALAFAREGAEVIATDLKPELIKDLSAHGIAEIYPLDVRDTAAVRAIASKVGPIDVLFNCAGFVHHGTVLSTSDEEWDFSFDVNVKSMHRTIGAFLQGMLDKGSGSIVNVASGASSVRGIANRYVYGASKAAVIGLTKAVAADFIRKGVRCNAICPGFIASDRADRPFDEKLLAAWKRHTPMDRLGTPHDVAPLAVYLASDESSYVTGQHFVVDGGFTIHDPTWAERLDLEND